MRIWSSILGRITKLTQRVAEIEKKMYWLEARIEAIEHYVKIKEWEVNEWT